MMRIHTNLYIYRLIQMIHQSLILTFVRRLAARAAGQLGRELVRPGKNGEMSERCGGFLKWVIITFM